EERAIAVRRRAVPREIDVVAVLDDRAAAEAAASAATAASAGVVTPLDRPARILVRGILLAIPQLLRFGARRHEPRTLPPALPVFSGQQSDAFAGVREAAVPPLRLREFGRLTREGRGERDDLVAERNFRPRVAAVERFGPKECRR